MTNILSVVVIKNPTGAIAATAEMMRTIQHVKISIIRIYS